MEQSIAGTERSTCPRGPVCFHVACEFAALRTGVAGRGHSGTVFRPCGCAGGPSGCCCCGNTFRSTRKPLFFLLAPPLVTCLFRSPASPVLEHLHGLHLTLPCALRMFFPFWTLWCAVAAGDPTLAASTCISALQRALWGAAIGRWLLRFNLTLLIGFSRSLVVAQQIAIGLRRRQDQASTSWSFSASVLAPWPMEISLSPCPASFRSSSALAELGSVSCPAAGRAVTPHVSCQFATLRERELAHAAVVGPIAGVSAAVGGQAAHRLKTLAAQLAGEGCVKWRSWVGKRWSGRWRWGRYYSAVVVANLRQALQTHGEVQALQVTWCNAGAVGKLVKGADRREDGWNAEASAAPRWRGSMVAAGLTSVRCCRPPPGRCWENVRSEHAGGESMHWRTHIDTPGRWKWRALLLWRGRKKGKINLLVKKKSKKKSYICLLKLLKTH